MGSKKKNKSNKLISMSEEERLRYLQHKAAMEEEAHRRKQQIIATYMNMKLKHEQTFTRLNSAKINQQWRQILRQLKNESLKDDIQDLEQHVHYVLDNKNRIIKNLLSDFDNAEFQYSLQFQEHMYTVSEFLKIHQKRLLLLFDWFTQQVQMIQHNHSKSKACTLKTIEDDTEYIKQEAEICSKDFKNKMKEVVESFDNRKNDLQTKLLYRSVKMEEKYADDITQLQKEYNEVLEQYKQNTESKLAHYKILSKKDNEDSFNVMQNYEKIQAINEIIEQRKSEINNLKYRSDNELNDLRVSKQTEVKLVMALKQKLNNNNLSHQTKLKFLVNRSNSVIRELTKLMNNGDSLFQVVNQCIKLTSRQEFINSMNEENRGRNNTILTLNTLNTKLNNFWRLHNAVALKIECLRKEKFEAREERKKLLKLLGYHMSSFRKDQLVQDQIVT